MSDSLPPTLWKSARVRSHVTACVLPPFFLAAAARSKKNGKSSAFSSIFLVQSCPRASNFFWSTRCWTSGVKFGKPVCISR